MYIIDPNDFSDEQLLNLNWDMKRINCWRSKTVNYRYKYLEPYEEEKKSRFTKEESEICEKSYQIYKNLNGEEKVYKFYKLIFIIL